jgi:hypothetical protein
MLSFFLFFVILFLALVFVNGDDTGGKRECWWPAMVNNKFGQSKSESGSSIVLGPAL